jgi:hypothetical protein
MLRSPWKTHLTIDDAREDVGQLRESMWFKLQVSISDATVAQCSAPPSESAKNAFFTAERDRADGALDGVVVEFGVAVVDEAQTSNQVTRTTKSDRRDFAHLNCFNHSRSVDFRCLQAR